MHAPRRTRLLAPVVAAAVLLSGCAPSGAPRPEPTASPTPTASPATPAAAPAEPCTSPLDGLSRRDRIAQLFTVGVSSVEDARRAVLEQRVGGIFLGGQVIDQMISGEELARLHGEAPLPLLVAIDEEGGRVSRVGRFAGPIPSARVMAATLSPEQVRGLARDRGAFLRRMGVTVDFAPSVDVSAQPDGEVIGDRSFSPDPDRVTLYARAFADGLRDSGVSPVFKHFPGHGDSSGDSHLESVTVPPLDRLVGRDLRPFAEVLATPSAAPPAAAVMMGHQQVPGLTEGDLPASLSPAAYRLLREGRGYGAPPFDGPVFTDDLSGMRAVSAGYPLPEAVTAALGAGADSPLWISTERLPEALDSAERALAEGRLSRPLLDASLRRMAAFRGVPGCLGGPVTGMPPAPGSLGGTGLPAGLGPAPVLPPLASSSSPTPP